MRRKKDQKMFCSVHDRSFKTLQKLSFLLTYTTQLMKLKLLGQGDYRSSSTTCFINCLNITFMRVFKELMKNFDKK